MPVGVIRLLRSPLREGEPLYTLGNIDQGVYDEGVHKGEQKPRKEGVWPEVLPDGCLQWEFLDTEHNRGLAAALTAPSPNPNPSFSYQAIYPEDALKAAEEEKPEEEGEEDEEQPGEGREESEEQPRRRGRPRKGE